MHIASGINRASYGMITGQMVQGGDRSFIQREAA